MQSKIGNALADSCNVTACPRTARIAALTDAHRLPEALQKVARVEDRNRLALRTLSESVVASYEHGALAVCGERQERILGVLRVSHVERVEQVGV
jgi:hypothetical protein